jgi:hypothetical protein
MSGRNQTPCGQKKEKYQHSNSVNLNRFISLKMPPSAFICQPVCEMRHDALADFWANQRYDDIIDNFDQFRFDRLSDTPARSSRRKNVLTFHFPKKHYILCLIKLQR